MWVFFIVNTTEMWHLTHYVLFKVNTCLSHPTVHISSYRIWSLCQGAAKSRKMKDYFRETRFCSAASYSLVPKDPNGDEETKLSLCHTVTFIKLSQEPTIPSPDDSWWTSPELHWEYSMQKWILNVQSEGRAQFLFSDCHLLSDTSLTIPHLFQ